MQHNVRVVDEGEDGSAERLQDMVDVLDMDCFHFTPLRQFEGATGREAFLRHFAEQPSGQATNSS